MFEHLNVRINDSHIDYRNNLMVNQKERQILRDLASKIAEIAARPEQETKKRLWIEHNALKPTRPPIFCDPENGWNEIITDDQIQCENELARYWEAVLRKELFWGESMGDDRVIEPFFDIHHIYTDSGWGLKEQRVGGEIDVYRLDGGSYKWEAPLKDYNDVNKLHFPEINIDYETTQKVFNLAQEILGDILHVRLKTVWWWSVGLTDDLAYLRGLENILYDVYDHPQELHKLMAFLSEGTLAKLDFLEKNGLLSLNNDGTFVGSGGYGWSEELPQQDFDGKVRLKDMWGMSESQITVGFSPQMFEEFVFQYQLPILEKFGLNCYGCCEPLNARWDVIKKIPRLRRVSVSPWANVEDMAEKLEDKYIFSWKPHPSVLATPNIDEEQIRQDIRRVLKITRNCRLEIIMKDNHTLGKNPENVIKWCRIAREEVESI
ncbi:hypothetical protein [Moorella sp. E306M]|uniref:hypothetical protein n=1 Tax=Moorella sp. E306M TaxID=2572683 RepID=UPI0010FFBF87|nr:hypothetical protein [Moorella sp. E306M]GEA19189.1 hypothetical protein E306M_23260 [Moorella sp. E306M]